MARIARVPRVVRPAARFPLGARWAATSSSAAPRSMTTATSIAVAAAVVAEAVAAAVRRSVRTRTRTTRKGGPIATRMPPTTTQTRVMALPLMAAGAPRMTTPGPTKAMLRASLTTTPT